MLVALIVFETIEISSIITSLSSASYKRSCVLFWSDNASRLCSTSLGIARPVLMVVAPIFTAATPVGAIIRTAGISRFDGPCPKVFTAI